MPADAPFPLLHMSFAVTGLAAPMAFFAAAYGYAPVFVEHGQTGQIRAMTGVPTMTCDLAQMRRAGDPLVLEFIAFRDGMGAPPAAPSGWAHLCMSVTSLHDELARIGALGAEQMGEITEFSDCIGAYCRVPGGIILELEEPKA